MHRHASLAGVEEKLSYTEAGLTRQGLLNRGRPPSSEMTVIDPANYRITFAEVETE
jgi:hypothetical protein